MEVVSAVITGVFALLAAIFSKRASKSASLTHLETKPNGGKSLADKIDQLGRRLIVMDERSERTERKVDQLSLDQEALSDTVHSLEKKATDN